jgi:hypothetical protein
VAHAKSHAALRPFVRNIYIPTLSKSQSRNDKSDLKPSNLHNANRRAARQQSNSGEKYREGVPLGGAVASPSVISVVDCGPNSEPTTPNPFRTLWLSILFASQPTTLVPKLAIDALQDLP